MDHGRVAVGCDRLPRFGQPILPACGLPYKDRFTTLITVDSRDFTPTRAAIPVRDIARELYGEGLYPTAVRIMDCIPGGLSCEWMTVNMAVRDAQEALGAPQ
jgi:hypothetical protein